MILFTICGYYIKDDEYYFLVRLGESDEYRLMYRDNSYELYTSYLKEYFLTICGYHL